MRPFRAQGARYAVPRESRPVFGLTKNSRRELIGRIYGRCGFSRYLPGPPTANKDAGASAPTSGIRPVLCPGVSPIPDRNASLKFNRLRAHTRILKRIRSGQASAAYPPGLIVAVPGLAATCLRRGGS